MQKIMLPFIVLMFIGFFTFLMFYSQGNDTPVEKTKNEVHQQKVQKTIVNDDGPLLSLWKDEANSERLAPDKVDTISTSDNKTIYTNNLHGYSLTVPSSWMIDNHQPITYTRFYGEEFRLDIITEDMQKSYTNYDRYINNTLSTVPNSEIKTLQIEDLEVKYAKYTDDRNGDLHQYAYYFINHGAYVHTIQLKTSDEEFAEMNKEIVNILKSNFHLRERQDIDIEQKISKMEFNPSISLNHPERSLEIGKGEVMQGFYTPNSYDIKKLDKQFGTQIGSQMFYKGMNSTYDYYVSELTLEQNRLPVVTFLFKDTSKPQENNVETTYNIIKGEYDGEIKNWAEKIKVIKSPVLLRLGNEMNGDWSEWNATHHSNDTDVYKLAYRHIVDVFKEMNVDNAYFVWNPNNNQAPYFHWNAAQMYYPGDDYVDFVGLTAYNFGKTKYDDFRYFDDLYKDLYKEYLLSFGTKPMVIGEYGSVSTNGDRAEFIRDAFEKLSTEYTNIKMVTWFNTDHAHYDFTINDETESSKAFKEALSKDNIVSELK